jgi:molybdenum cofactor cytidylyltransferase
MLPIERTAVLLLAAGLSTRFPRGDKLLAPLAGKPLIAYAVDLAAALPFASRFAVVPEGEGPLARLLASRDFRLVRNPDPAAGRDSSLRLGLRAALDDAPAGVLVLLGDMPAVTVAHIERLHAEADQERAAISSTGRVPMPPVLIPAGPARMALAQDRMSVKKALGPVAEVIAPEASLRDFDTAADFEAAT